ncbi:MAG: pepsin/retropepsin-like aspartic protease family protein [Saprospiraceae bacterium]
MLRLSFLFGIFLYFFPITAACSQVDHIVIPFQLIGNTIIIQAGVQDRSGFFVLDSGSPNLVLNTKHFENIRMDATSFHSTDLTGTASNTLTQTIVHLKVGNIERRNQKAFLIDLSRIEQGKKINILGVIGYKFLKQFEILFDYQQKEITLFALDRKGERMAKSSLHTPPNHVFDLKKSSHFLYLEAQIGNETIKLGLDCGAETSVLDKDAVRSFKNHFFPSHGVSLIAFNGKKSSVNIGSVRQVFIGNTELELFEVIVMDLESINQNLVVKLDGLLGNGSLSRNKIAINYKKQTLSIWDPTWLAKR